MRLTLSRGELAVLADHLSVDPTFAIGELSEVEEEQVRAEGWRSLVVRGLARIEGDRVEVSSELAQRALDVLAPSGLMSYTRVIDGKAELSTVLVGKRGLVSATPVWDGVGRYASVDPSRIVDVIVADLDLPEGSVGLYRLELVDGRKQNSVASLTWARSSGGDVVSLEGEDGVATSMEQIRAGVSDLVTASGGIVSEMASPGDET